MIQKFTFFMLLYATMMASAQHSADSTTKTKKLVFGRESGGAVCVNGLEKLEIAFAHDKSFTFAQQLHFYGPRVTQGRVFILIGKENIKKNTFIDFFEGTLDLTGHEFPLHLGFTIGTNKIEKKSNIFYQGPAVTLYLSDIKKVHKVFHILRSQISYVKMTKYFETTNEADSSISLGRKLEFSTFYQVQPLHLTPKLSIFSEGLYCTRKNKMYGEIEIGIRHKKIMDELIGIGVKINWEEYKFHTISALIRFNVGNPNPRHT